VSKQQSQDDNAIGLTQSPAACNGDRACVIIYPLHGGNWQHSANNCHNFRLLHIT